jgi:hypothetical protein
MIVEAKDLLQGVLENHPATSLVLNAIVRNAAEEKMAVSGRKHPFAALITYPGTFDGTESGIRAFKSDAGAVEKKFVRGEARLPVIVRVWAKTEDDADAIVSAFLPFIPHRWTYKGITGKVEIVRTEASDFASKLSEQYIAAVVVEFSCPIAVNTADLP